MVSIRRAEIEDLHQMQNCNLWCLPENYTFKYYFFHYLSGPQILYVAVDDGKVVGYVMAKIEEEENSSVLHGHITSISVLRTHRKLGIANKLMIQSHKDMESIYGASYVSLHVRITNTAAFNLYHRNLQYEIHDIEAKYYADGEDAYNMRKYFVDEQTKQVIIANATQNKDQKQPSNQKQVQSSCCSKQSCDTKKKKNDNNNNNNNDNINNNNNNNDNINNNDNDNINNNNNDIKNENNNDNKNENNNNNEQKKKKKKKKNKK